VSSEISQPAEQSSIDECIVTALTGIGQPQPFTELCRVCRVRTAALCQRLAALIADRRVIKSSNQATDISSAFEPCSL